MENSMQPPQGRNCGWAGGLGKIATTDSMMKRLNVNL